mgnify:CR=1 FL=1
MSELLAQQKNILFKVKWLKKEMLEKGISETAIEKVQPLFNFTGTINEKIEKQ